MVVPDPLFTELADGRLQPNGTARGPWSPHALHGGPVAAAVARAAEAALGSTGSEAVEPVRMTVDLERPVPLAPLRIDAEIVRAGRKVQVAAATVRDASEQVLATARVLATRRSSVDLPADLIQPADERPPPVDAGHGEPAYRPDASLEYFHADGVEHRYVAGRFSRQGPATDWIRLAVPVVAGEEPSPFQRTVAAADFCNGISSVLPWDRWSFINPDLTVSLHRTPVGPWICVDATSRLDPSGVGTAEADLFDERGRVGRAVQTLIVQPIER